MSEHKVRWVFLLVVIAGALSNGWLFHKTSAQARQGLQAHAALCVFKHDLEVRAAGSRAFLREHPDGIPGIPASLIRNGLMNQQRTIDSLSNLNCKEA